VLLQILNFEFLIPNSVAVLAVVTSSPPSIEGGHLVIARALVVAARECGHDAHLVITPDCQFGRQISSYLDTWRTDVNAAVGQRVDEVISLRYPSYAVTHPQHVCWLNHTMREYYDLWARFSGSLSPQGRLKERGKRIVIRAVDRWLLTHNVTEVVAQSRTVQRRLLTDFGLKSDVLMPPPPPRPYRCEGYGDYLFAVSRLTPLKRLDLLIRALAHSSASRVRAVIAGEGESRLDLDHLIASLGVGDRVTLAGRISDEEMLDHYARCRAVCFPPVDEDYGFVTVEAFSSRKGVLTCVDSGGPADLVRDGVTGLVSEPNPEALAGCIARVMDDGAFAERIGSAAAAQVATMTWSDAVTRLLRVT
jgi:glycosyltransferase involved in cell wall biosynthesis